MGKQQSKLKIVSSGQAAQTRKAFMFLKPFPQIRRMKPETRQTPGRNIPIKFL